MAGLLVTGSLFAQNPILDGTNGRLTITGFGGGTASMNTLGGLPLGTVDGSPTGQVAVKVMTVSGGGGGGGAVTVTSGTVTALTPIVSGTVTSSFAAGQVLRSGSCNLFRVTANYLGSTQAYLQLFNASAVPSDGAIAASGSGSLIQVSIIAPGTNVVDVPLNPGIPCPSGVTAVMSSTCQVGGTNWKTALTGTVGNYFIQAQ